MTFEFTVMFLITISFAGFMCSWTIHKLDSWLEKIGNPVEFIPEKFDKNKPIELFR